MKNVWTAGHSNRDTASFISGENTILNGMREPLLSGWCQDGESAVRKVRGHRAQTGQRSLNGPMVIASVGSPVPWPGIPHLPRNHLESREEI